MRGDRPFSIARISSFSLFTPHARGSTVLVPFRRAAAAVYPACAGIDLKGRHISVQTSCLPRMRGDRPYTVGRVAPAYLFTPHARGST